MLDLMRLGTSYGPPYEGVKRQLDLNPFAKHRLTDDQRVQLCQRLVDHKDAYVDDITADFIKEFKIR